MKKGKISDDQLQLLQYEVYALFARLEAAGIDELVASAFTLGIIHARLEASVGPQKALLLIDENINRRGWRDLAALL